MNERKSELTGNVNEGSKVSKIRIENSRKELMHKENIFISSPKQINQDTAGFNNNISNRVSIYPAILSCHYLALMKFARVLGHMI